MADIKYDLNAVMKEYGQSFDFGFTATDEEEYNSAIAEKDVTVEHYKHRLTEVEKLVLNGQIVSLFLKHRFKRF